MRAKLCLVGEPAVGKSSLVRRFVYDQFDNRYQATLGAKVSKKEVDLRVGKRPIHAILTIWDIMGEPSFRELLREAYFSNVQGVMAIGDVTRLETIKAVGEWIDAACRVSGPVPVVLLGTKNDLPAERGAGDLIREVADRYAAPSWVTSAKTGENVDLAFYTIAVGIARKGLLGRTSPSEP
jgi:small GTP-binding protein